VCEEQPDQLHAMRFEARYARAFEGNEIDEGTRHVEAELADDLGQPVARAVCRPRHGLLYATHFPDRQLAARSAPAPKLSRRYATRWALRSRTSSSVPWMKLDLRRRMKFSPSTYKPGTLMMPPS
jgi:hypothetical protein